MKSSLLFLMFSAFTVGNMFAKTYYVSTTGNNSNSGLTTALAWKTMAYAASSSSPVVAGDIIYVQSGNYGAEKVVFQKSGIAGNPISFIGYKTTPGDAPPLLVNNANPYASFLSTDMPLYNGGNRAAGGTAFNCTNQKYLVIKNFQIQNYVNGFVAGGVSQTAGNHVLYNINIMSVGDVNASYSGAGFLFGSMGTSFSNYNTITNCMVVNAPAEGMSINGDNNIVTDCKVYCNENTGGASTDYYIILCGSYNTVKNCYIERAPGLSHKGHGISVKSNAEQVVDKGLSLPVINPQYNKIMYCIAKNMGESFCVRHRGVQNNLFYHCKAIGTHTGATGSAGGEGRCMVTRDGASNNTFDGCISENCASGIVFFDSVEDGDTGTNPPGHPGNNNKYINCLIYNNYIGVDYDDYGVASDAGDNTIANCTFYKTRYMHFASRRCANMKYIGNIYHGCLPTSSGGYFKGSTYSADIVPNGTNTYFRNCNFVNIQGGMPANFVSSAVGSIASDPLFVNAASLDFHLSATSPCKDASIAHVSVPNDFDSIARPSGAGVDMGAYEYKILTPSLTVTLSSIPAKCNGGNTGSATVTVSGGKTPYKYAWSNGQTNAVCSGLIAGSYSVTVSDANLISKTFMATITQPLINVNNITSKSNVSFYGGNDGAISIVSEGGTPAYTYLWLPSNQVSATATGLYAGDYVLKVTDANGCIATKTITITQPAAPSLSVTLSSINVKCNGENNGSSAVTVSGGKTPYKYAWSNGQTNMVCSGLVAGNYSVTVSDADLISRTLTVVITQPLVNMNSVTSKSNVSYYGGNDGAITIISEGGTPAYTYLWLPSNQVSATATGLYAGDHVLKVTDANGCIATRTIAITQPAPPSLSVTVSSVNVRCSGENNGSAAVVVSGGKLPYQYAWSNGQTNMVCSGLVAGNYSVTVSDANLTSKTLTIAITQPLVNINNVTSKSNVSYYGGNDGAITIVSEGGTPAYTYLWLPSNQVSATVTGLYAGDHMLKVTDASGCIATQTIVITQPAPSPLSITLSSTNVKCNGENNGSAAVTVSGGKAPYKYAWSNGQTDAISSGLVAGNYSVTVSDANLTSKTLTAAITQPLVNANNITSKSNVSFYGGNDGSITIISEGGTPAYTYLWLPSGQVSATATGLYAGDHVLKVTDANGCISTQTIVITQPALVSLSITLSSTNVKCNGENNGSATVAVSGGKAPYQYTWSNGQTNALASGLVAGNYSVIVSDADMISKTLTVEITQPLVNMNSVTSKSNVSYYGGNDGKLTIFSEGGTPPYTYFWSPSNKTTAIVTGLYAGEHFLKVTDANGCIATRTLTITQPSPPFLSVTLSSVNVRCNGENNGSATVAVSGGKAPYQYTWSNGQTNAVCSGLVAGNYSVVVSDANLSAKTLTVTITQPLVNMNSVTSKSNVSYYGGNDGKLTIFSEGGTPPYTYFWSPSNKTTAIVTGLYAGEHFLKVTDANGCIATRTLTITQPSPPSLSVTLSSVNVRCNGENNGSATVAVSGGKTPYKYLWSNGQTNASSSGLTAGSYSVTVSDANLSPRTLTVTITQPLVNMNSVTSKSNVSYYGGNDGKITIFSEGGTPAYTYFWSPSNKTTAIVTGLYAGNHILRVTDANGCIATRTLTISQPAPVQKSDDSREVVSTAVSGLYPVVNDSSVMSADAGMNGSGDAVNVFPNPATGPFNVVISHPKMGNEVLVVVRDMLGKEYYSKVVLVSNTTEVIAVDYSKSLIPGVYTVIATSNNNIFEKKIIIQ